MKLHNASLNIIRHGQAPSGAYVASPTFSQYGYAWLRDGTWTAYAMDCVGQHDSARAFYSWVGQTLRNQQSRFEKLFSKCARNEPLDETDYLPTRFTLDGFVDHDQFWWNFQLDGYGTWLWGLAQHIELVPDSDLWDSLRTAVTLTMQYLSALWPSANYDCWEEFRDKIHTSTLASLYGGLSAIRRIEPGLVPDHLPEQIQSYILQNCVSTGHFRKYVGSSAVDARLLWVAVPYRVVEVTDPRFIATVQRIEQEIHRPGGGVYRYAADTYYGGGEWILLTAFLAWTYIELGRPADARRLMTWIESQATPAGELAEQVSTHLLDPSRYPEWEQKWGTVACPLLWSHAMVLIVESLLEKQA